MIKLEKKNVPIISIIIYCLPFILGSIIGGGNIFSDNKQIAILHRPKRKMRQNSLFFLIM